ncbi:hypothetical protein SOV_47950 [Sporomusa ovata DSM 2662]|uniref:Uncharacterized protein n=1 Tax=Sporomusa ovata TaxID=2378 RepID=A0A0U1L012_9FIRM|nr:class I SAM-dependent methyltransferase [Sporomusa ovata]EQB27172.1 tellurite resistance methyltransferase TehB [Sporomusa ovata DSM 2662]CQR73008.1 hypothetical protein SpAn4DRAFT_2240 [Sporomusa ovata]
MIDSQAAGCEVNILQADMMGYEFAVAYDVIYSHGSLQFLPLEQRQNHFDKYKRYTNIGGLNAHLLFVEKPFIKTAPDWEKMSFSICLVIWLSITMNGKSFGVRNKL